jgi:putative ABC transport system permease protein
MKTTFPAAVLQWMAGLKDMHIDAWVLGFTVVASLAAGVACGLPAIWQLLRRTTALDLNVILKEGGRSHSAGPARGAFQNALVVSEVALALMLLVGAALMVTTFERMLTVNAGFNPKNLLTAEVSLSASKYRDDTQVRGFYSQVVRSLETIPQAQSAAVAGWGAAAGGVYIEGRPDPRPGEPRPGIRTVSARFFDSMAIPILKGRPLSEQDGPDSARVIVIGESLARHYWPDSDPLGRRIRLDSAQSPWLTVVGVSGDVKNQRGHAARLHPLSASPQPLHDPPGADGVRSYARCRRPSS